MRLILMLAICFAIAGCTSSESEAQDEDPVDDPGEILDGDVLPDPTPDKSPVITLWLHADTQDHWMDETPASSVEEGDREMRIGQATNGYEEKFPSKTTLGALPSGTEVTVHFHGYTLAPVPSPSMKAILTADGVEVGVVQDEFNSPILDAAAAHTGECLAHALSFETTGEIPAGADLALVLSIESGAAYLECYPGGEEGPRVVIG